MLGYNLLLDELYVPVVADMHIGETSMFDIKYSVPVHAVEMNYFPLPVPHSSEWLQIDWCQMELNSYGYCLTFLSQPSLQQRYSSSVLLEKDIQMTIIAKGHQVA